MNAQKFRVLRPLAIAAMIFTGAAYAADSPPARPGSNLGRLMNGTTSALGLNGLPAGAGLRSMQANRGFANQAQGRQLRRGGALGDMLNGLPQARPGVGLAAYRAARAARIERLASLPGLGRADALTSDDSSDDSRSNDDDNGFLGVENSSTLGTDEGSDDDNGFLGIGDSSVLGTDDSGRTSDNSDANRGGMEERMNASFERSPSQSGAAFTPGNRQRLGGLNSDRSASSSRSDNSGALSFGLQIGSSQTNRRSERSDNASSRSVNDVGNGNSVVSSTQSNRFTLGTMLGHGSSSRVRASSTESSSQSGSESGSESGLSDSSSGSGDSAASDSGTGDGSN